MASGGSASLGEQVPHTAPAGRRTEPDYVYLRALRVTRGPLLGLCLAVGTLGILGGFPVGPISFYGGLAVLATVIGIDWSLRALRADRTRLRKNVG